MQPGLLRPLILVALTSAGLVLPAVLHPLVPLDMAWADDDDDDGDDSSGTAGRGGADNDSGRRGVCGDGGTFLRNLFAPPRPGRRAPAAAAPPARAGRPVA